MSAALDAFDAGWRPLPLPLGKKYPPPDGLTGYEGRNLSRSEVETIDWEQHSLGLRMPPDVVGVDTDVYHRGGITMSAAAERFGVLPPTAVSTARSDGSGIRFYRIPIGTALTTPGVGVDIIQWFHRYSLVAPSTNPAVDDAPYQWIDEQSGETLDGAPDVADLPELPWSWIDGLTSVGKGRKASRGRNASQAATESEVREFLDGHTEALMPSALKGIKTRLGRPLTKARHDTLLEVACWVMREAAAGFYSAVDGIDILGEWWDGVMDDPVRRDGPEFGSVLCWAIAEAMAEPERIAEMRESATSDAPAEGLPAAWVDVHVGEAFAEHLGDGWLYVTEWCKWMWWDGRRWAADNTERVHEIARQWIIALGVAAVQRSGDNGDVLKKIATYKRVGNLEAVVKVARRIKACAPDVFDRHIHLLNAGNGVIDLRTGDLLPHNPALKLTKIAGAEFHPEATHADVDAVLEAVSAVTLPALQLLLGTAASGENGDDIVAVFDGQGGNGKTTVLVGAASALGDYAAVVPPALVMQTGRDEHPHIYETLRGVRLAYIEETEEDGGLRLERVKALSGGGTITARPMGGSYYEFEPTHTLVIATNHRPIVNSAEDAIWRRLKLVPFPYRYTNEPTRPTDRLGDVGIRTRVKLGAAQQAAFLAWIVAGAVKAYRLGGGVPAVKWSAEVDAATGEWRAAEDAIGRFISTDIEFNPASRTRGTTVFEAWQRWCGGEGRHPGQAKNFHRKFKDHNSVVDAGVEVIRPKNATTYLGVRLVS